MTGSLSFFADEKAYDPLPSPCPSCGHSIGLVGFRDGAVVALTCQKCRIALDPAIVRVHPLCKPCRCGATEASGFGFVVPRANNNALHCLACGTWNWNVSNADLGIAPEVPGARPRISEGLRMRVFEDAGHVCLYHGGAGDLHVGHALSVSEGRQLGLGDDVLFDWWNLFAICERCNLALNSRSVKPSTYITLIKPGEFDKPARAPMFTKVLVALGKALALRKEAA